MLPEHTLPADSYNLLKRLIFPDHRYKIAQPMLSAQLLILPMSVHHAVVLTPTEEVASAHVVRNPGTQQA